MFDFKAKMHQNQFSAGETSTLDPAGEVYSSPLDLLPGMKGTYF